MNKTNILLMSIALSTALILLGCSSSQETSEKTKQEVPPPAVQKQPEQPAQTQEVQPAKVDTASVKPPAEAPTKDTVNVQEQPSSTERTAITPTPTGNFSVQIGAFSLADKADLVAAQARQRFSQKNVYSFHAKDTGLIKVMVGDFVSKDEARKFRDQIVQQFPEEYKDAWVAPIPYEK